MGNESIYRLMRLQIIICTGLHLWIFQHRLNSIAPKHKKNAFMPIIYCYRFCSALSLETVVFLYFLRYIVIWNYEKYSTSERKIFLSIVSTCIRIHFLIIKYVDFLHLGRIFKGKKKCMYNRKLMILLIEGGWVSEFGRMYGSMGRGEDILYCIV